MSDGSEKRPLTKMLWSVSIKTVFRCAFYYFNQMNLFVGQITFFALDAGVFILWTNAKEENRERFFEHQLTRKNESKDPLDIYSVTIIIGFAEKKKKTFHINCYCLL